MVRDTFTVFAGLLIGALLLGIVWAGSRPLPPAPVDIRSQGWTPSELERWQRATQGSRLMPLDWFMALEQPGSAEPFSDEAYLTSFGYLPATEGAANRLPIGFAVDQQADDTLGYSKLRWYEQQRGDAAPLSEPWIGLNCSACHTGSITYEGTTLQIQGGSTLADFQSFIEAVDAALTETRSDRLKFDRFATAVLQDKDSGENRALLIIALDDLIAWQDQTAAMNRTDLRYGPGRLDAFGHIYNKVILFAGRNATEGHPSDAPVSYPFLWGVHRHQRLQTNGVAENTRVQFANGRFLDYGALGRNTGQVIGVFGDLVVDRPSNVAETLAGYPSSVQTETLEWFEAQIARLESPKWPESFPGIDPDLVREGRALFGAHCVDCHRTPAFQKRGETVETLHAFKDTSPENLTDIWMACNAFTRSTLSGAFEGTPEGWFRGDPIPGEAKVATLLKTAVTGTLVGRKGPIVRTGAATFLGAPFEPVVVADDDAMIEMQRTVEAPRNQKDVNREICLSADHPMLAYKARPLDGIWATPPYLHNGSVPSLYDLLLPASDRPDRFWVGHSDFDPENVGYTRELGVARRAMEFNVRDEDGNVIPGNSNEGHEYGADQFSERDRRALVEYMKTL
ncbi:MAG: di-heme-cytochrome C peroxidase [Pseudomonadota bacterium]